MFPIMMLKLIKMLLRDCLFVILKKLILSLFAHPHVVPNLYD